MHTSPKFASKANWRSEEGLKFDIYRSTNGTEHAFQEKSNSSMRPKSSLTSGMSSATRRSIELMTSPADDSIKRSIIKKSTIDDSQRRPKSPGFSISADTLLSRQPGYSTLEATTVVGRTSPFQSEFTTSKNLRFSAPLSFSSGVYDFQSRPTTSSNVENSAPLLSSPVVSDLSRFQSPGGDRQEDRVRTRPPIAPGKPRPVLSESLPRSSTIPRSNRNSSKFGSQERSSYVSDSRRTSPFPTSFLDGAYEKDSYSGAILSSENNLGFSIPSSRNNELTTEGKSTYRKDSDLAYKHPGENRYSDFDKSAEMTRKRQSNSISDFPQATAGELESVDLFQRPRSAQEGSIRRSFTATNTGKTDLISSLRNSTEMNPRSSYDDIMRRLQELEERSNSSYKVNFSSESPRLFQVSNATTDKTADFSTQILSNQTSNTARLAEISGNERLYRGGEDERRFTKNETLERFGDSPRVENRTGEKLRDRFVLEQIAGERFGDRPGQKSKTMDRYDDSHGLENNSGERFGDSLGLENRTGERMSAYSKNDAIEGWLRNVRKASIDSSVNNISTSQRNEVGREFREERNDKYGHGEPFKKTKLLQKSDSFSKYETLNSSDTKKAERYRRLTGNFFENKTSSAVGLLAKSDLRSIDSIYDTGKIQSFSKGRLTEPQLQMSKQEVAKTSQELATHIPKERTDTRVALLRECLDRADVIVDQPVSSAVDNGFLRLPDGLTLNGTSKHKDTFEQKDLKLQLRGDAGADRHTVSAVSTDLQERIRLLTDSQKSGNLSLMHGNSSSSGKPGPISFDSGTLSTGRQRSPSSQEKDTIKKVGSKTESENLNGSEITSNFKHYGTESFYQSSTLDRNWKTSFVGTRPSTLDWKISSSGNSYIDSKKKTDENVIQIEGYEKDGGYRSSNLTSTLWTKRDDKDDKLSTIIDKSEKNKDYKTLSKRSEEILKRLGGGSLGVTPSTVAVRINTGGNKDTKDDFTIRDSSNPDAMNPGLTTRNSNSPVIPRRVWYSEENLAAPENGNDGDIASKFDYKPDSFRYVLRKDPGESTTGRPISPTAVATRRWRSELALVGDEIENTTGDVKQFGKFYKHTGIDDIGSSGFQATKESKAPVRRQVTWEDESSPLIKVPAPKTDLWGYKTTPIEPQEVGVNRRSMTTLRATSPVEDSRHDYNISASTSAKPSGLEESRSLFRSLRTSNSSMPKSANTVSFGTSEEKNRHTLGYEVRTGDGLDSGSFPDKSSNHYHSLSYQSISRRSPSPYLYNQQGDTFTQKSFTSPSYDNMKLLTGKGQASGSSGVSFDPLYDYRHSTLATTRDIPTDKTSAHIPTDSVSRISQFSKPLLSNNDSESQIIRSGGDVDYFEPSGSHLASERTSSYSAYNGKQLTDIPSSKSYEDHTRKPTNDARGNENWRHLAFNESSNSAKFSDYHRQLTDPSNSALGRSYSSSTRNPHTSNKNATLATDSHPSTPILHRDILPFNQDTPATKDSNFLQSYTEDAHISSVGNYRRNSDHLMSSLNPSTININSICERTSNTYSENGYPEPLTSSYNRSHEEVRQRGYGHIGNGLPSDGIGYLSKEEEKHDDGVSSVSEMEFVVMRSGAIIKRRSQKANKNGTRDGYGQKLASKSSENQRWM